MLTSDVVHMWFLRAKQFCEKEKQYVVENSVLLK